MKEKEILEIFAKTGGILNGHFKLTSGRHSDTYMQCAKLFTSAKEAEKLCKELASKIKEKVDIVVSPAVGGILMGYEISRHLNVDNIFTEREEGKMILRRGFSVQKGMKAIIVEDVVTTGGSVFEVKKYLEEQGVEVVAVASIVDRSNGEVDFGVNFYTLLSIEVVSYEEINCPLCKEGKPIIKLGSRDILKNQ